MKPAKLSELIKSSRDSWSSTTVAISGWGWGVVGVGWERLEASGTPEVGWGEKEGEASQNMTTRYCYEVIFRPRARRCKIMQRDIARESSVIITEKMPCYQTYYSPRQLTCDAALRGWPRCMLPNVNQVITQIYRYASRVLGKKKYHTAPKPQWRKQLYFYFEYFFVCLYLNESLE